MLMSFQTAAVSFAVIVIAHGMAIGQLRANVPSADLAVATTSQADAKSEQAVPSPTPEPPTPPAEPPTLSVAPIDHLTYPPERPAWVDVENDLEGKTHRWIVRTPPCDSREECDDRLAIALWAEMENYTAQLVGTTDVDGLLSIEDEEVLKQLVARRYDGTLSQGNLPAFESVLELQIGPEFQAGLQRAWQNREVRQRLGAVGVLVTGGWLALMTVAGITAGVSRHRATRG